MLWVLYQVGRHCRLPCIQLSAPAEMSQHSMSEQLLPQGARCCWLQLSSLHVPTWTCYGHTLTAGGSYLLRSGHSKAALELACQLCLPTSLPRHCLFTCQPLGLSMPLLLPGICSRHRSLLSSAQYTQQPMGPHRKYPMALLLPSPSHITEG